MTAFRDVINKTGFRSARALARQCDAHTFHLDVQHDDFDNPHGTARGTGVRSERHSGGWNKARRGLNIPAPARFDRVRPYFRDADRSVHQTLWWALEHGTITPSVATDALFSLGSDAQHILFRRAYRAQEIVRKRIGMRVARSLCDLSGADAIAAQLVLLREVPTALEDFQIPQLVRDLRWTLRCVVPFEPFYHVRDELYRQVYDCLRSLPHVEHLLDNWASDEIDTATEWREALKSLNRLGLVDGTFRRQHRLMGALVRKFSFRWTEEVTTLYQRKRPTEIIPGEPIYEAFRSLRQSATRRNAPIPIPKHDVTEGHIGNVFDDVDVQLRVPVHGRPVSVFTPDRIG